MKNKKGFTLIELLAVIVILAIIALIATPIILNMINEARKSSAKSSALGYIDAIEYNNGFAQIEPNKYTPITSGNVSSINVKQKGKKPAGGTVTIDTKGKVTNADLCINGYRVIYENKNVTSVTKGCDSDPIITPDPEPQPDSDPEPEQLDVVFYLGELVYFDPISEAPCNENTFDIEKIKNGTSTCYKWRVITIGDTVDNDKITVQLDHNITSTNVWAVGNSNTTGPDRILPMLADQTYTWTRVPKLNYTYDTSMNRENDGYNYGVMTCINGICNRTINEDTRLVAGTEEKPLRARIITGEEVTELTKYIGVEENSIADKWTLKASYKDIYYFSHSGYKIGTKSTGTGNKILSWMIENTRNYTSSGASDDIYSTSYNNNGYWTLSPISNREDSAWHVYYSGSLDDNTVNSQYGVRPVISMPKSAFTYNLTNTNNPVEIEADGNEHIIRIGHNGKYKLEVWGASGGNDIPASTYTSQGGYGSYSVGYINLKKNDLLYINVGGRGIDTSATPTYNGGARGNSGGSGGGATHIATKPGQLYSLENNKSSILIVAGGGGGANADTDKTGYNTNGGHAGGYIGGHATQIEGSCSSSCTQYDYPSGGTQENGGFGITSWSSGTTSSTQYVGKFGQGATGTSSYGGGGGGYYGGASGQHNAGGGGSGYLSPTLSNAAMYCYDCEESSEPATKTIKNNQVSENPEPMKSKIGNGYAKIIYISE